MKQFRYIIIFCLMITGEWSFAQSVNTFSGESFKLSSATGNGNKEYLAHKTITLSDGFHVTASTDGEFRAAIMEHIEPEQPASESVNYVKTEVAAISGISTGVALSALSEGVQKHSVISYLDGIGKVIQSVALKSTKNGGNSIIQPVEYDAYGRQENQYLAYSKGGDVTSYNASAVSEQGNFYSAGVSGLEGDDKPFSTAVFDDTPLSRLLKSTAPGSDWHDNNKNQSMKFYIDGSGTIRKWTIGTGGYPQTTSTYPAGYLSYNEVTNEEGRTVRNYVDPSGKLILSESVGTDASVYKTYYAYDAFGNLLAAIPPVAVRLASSAGWSLSTADANDLCYLYTYDSQNRLVESKNPGVAPVYIVYDKWHRIVLTQDGNQRSSSTKKWSFVKYDAFNRVIATGIYASNSTRASLASTVLGASYAHNEDRNSSAVGYSLNQSFPTTVTESDLLQIVYYDNYSYVSNSGWDVEGKNYSYVAPSGFTGTATNAVLGLVTGAKVKILGTSRWLNAVVRYDEKYRVIQVRKENHLNGIDIVSVQYNDFKGTIQKTHFNHSSSIDSFTMLESYDYDNNDRVVNKWRTVGTGSPVLVTNYSYNELGQVIEQNIHSTDNGTSFLQSVDYSYNIRGWLKGINDSGLSTNTDSNALDDLFGLTLNYTNAVQVNGQNTAPKYDGSISSTSWKNEYPDKTDKEHVYGYDYDARGRISKARYATKSGSSWTGNAGMYDTQYTYEDEHGNLKTIKRNAEKAGAKVAIDDIVLDYLANSNRLEDVSDAQSDTGFKDAVSMITEYTYDANGNMTSDLNAEITSITYNLLNRAEQITIGKTGGDIYISNTYDAAGNKLSMVVEDDNNNVLMSIDYTSGIHYVDGQLAYMQTAEGRILKYGSNYEHEYMLADHQGNVRTTFGMLHDTDVYLATMESERATEEQQDFLNMSSNFVELYNHTKSTIELPNPDRSKYIAPGSSGNIGPAIAVAVSSGDKISAEIYALFDNSSSSNNTGAPAGILQAVASTFGTASGEALYGQFSNAIASLVSGWNNSSSVTPNAYLNLIWVSSSVTSSSFVYDKVEPTAYTKYEPLNVEFTAPGNGTVYIYVANESDLSSTNLFLDDFLVVHEKTTSSLNIVSTANYYPFGMKMDAESYDHEAREKQRYGYNGNEEIDGGDLSLMDFNARIYNPSLGRFMGSDALASLAMASSPYAFSNNDPINFIDPSGYKVEPYRDAENGYSEDHLYWYGGEPGYRIGPGSGNHWSDPFRSVEGNAMTMSSSTFNSFYGVNSMNDQQKASFATSIGDPGYIVYTNDGIYLYLDKSFQADFAGGGTENWYMAKDLGLQQKDGLIDLNSPKSGQQLADYLRNFAIEKRKNPRLSYPYLHEFIDVRTSLGRMLSMANATRGNKKVNGEFVQITISWHFNGFGSQYDPNTTRNQIRAGGNIPFKENSLDVFNTWYANGDGAQLISFTVKNNNEFGLNLHNYIYGY